MKKTKAELGHGEWGRGVINLNRVTFKQRADEVRVIREKVFQVEGMSGMCKGPEAGAGERMIENEFGQAGRPCLSLSLFFAQLR